MGSESIDEEDEQGEEDLLLELWSTEEAGYVLRRSRHVTKLPLHLP